MSPYDLLKAVKADTVGEETMLRVVGTREPPSKISVQIAVTGRATVQMQGRLSREAPWVNLGAATCGSAILYMEPVQYLRAVASDLGADSLVSVWAIWGW